ncbi:MAG: DUF4215 domain-containing protein [Deltaproteobacteria bacterium]|nr:DUF4215 domain-containing protein [Deltaproteobacteria bacterium]
MLKRLFILSLLLSFYTQALWADDAIHTFPLFDPLASFHVDDTGGSVDNGGDDLSYYLQLPVDQSAFGTLAIYANQNGNATVDNGMDAWDPSDFINGNGVDIFPLAVVPQSTVDGQVGLQGIGPLTPVTYLASQSGLEVSQVSYSRDDQAWVVMEYRITNNTTEDQIVRVGLINDFDVDVKTVDWMTGYEPSTQTVWQMEGLPLDPSFTTVGVSWLRGGNVLYRLETCTDLFFCDILASDAERQAFFEQVPGEFGDLTGGLTYQDFAVSISADLGTLEVGDSETVVFCYVATNGLDEVESMDNLVFNAEACEEFYTNEIENCGNGLTNSGEQCDDGDLDNSDTCPDDQAGGATCQLAFCGDGFIWNTDGGVEICDDGDINIHDSCPDGPEGTCQPAICGDGLVWNTDGGSETCDDGNSSVNDSCPDGAGGTCLVATCGDGYLWNTDGGSETCDDGNAVLTDACPSGPMGTCHDAFCGDGFVQAGVESCDDGNNNTNDACPSGSGGTCQPASCGDGFVRAGVETCDDHNAVLTDACPSGPAGTCQNARCGDGFIQAGVETCDDGNNNTNDACPSGSEGSCQPASCGDGFVQSGVESCDDGNNNINDHCPSGPAGTCQTATCGDGFVSYIDFEVCDDGNNVGGDGCSANCRVFETCGNGVLDPGEGCDDGNTILNDNCPSGPSGTCQPATCGDGRIWNAQDGQEACDDSNREDGDGCSSSCQIEVSTQEEPPPPPFCGDGIVNQESEQCDDGNLNDGDNCNSNCLYPIRIQGAIPGPVDQVTRALGCSLQKENPQSNFFFSLISGLSLLLFLGRLRLSKK